MSEVTVDLSERVEPHEKQRAYEAARLAKARASAKAGRLVPVSDVRAWVDRLETDHELPVPRAPR